MQRWRTRILFILAGIIVALVAGEMGLRLLGIEYPPFYDYDAHVGHRLRPGIKGYYLKEGGGYVSINSDGLRDREHAITKPTNTLRIAVLGGSYSEAMQVNREEAFWAIMEKQLQSCDNLRGRDIEVINFGQSGFGTTQQLLALQHRAWKYSPDIVLLEFTSSDVSDNTLALKKWDYLPYHVYQGDTLVLDDRRTRKKWIEKVENNRLRRTIFHWQINSRLSQVMRHGQKVFKEWRSRQKPGGSDGQGRGVVKNRAVYREPTSPDWQEAWRVTEGVLLLMRDEVVQKGAKFFVVMVAKGDQVHPDPKFREEVAKKIGVKDLFYPDRRIEKFCQRHRIPVLLLGPDFPAYATRHRVFFHGFGDNLGDGHWNQKGHRLAAEMLTKWLCPQLN